MKIDNVSGTEWIAQIRLEIHDTTIALMHEAIERGGEALLLVPRPIDAIAQVLGSRIHRVSDELLRGNKGLCTERDIVVEDTDGRHWVQRFTIAHELGHQWLGTEADEWECNAFAGSILIPDADVQRELERRHLGRSATLEQWARYERSGGVMTQLVRRYGVGYHAMIRGLADYGWVTDIAQWTSPAYGLSLYEQYEHFYRQPHSG